MKTRQTRKSELSDTGIQTDFFKRYSASQTLIFYKMYSEYVLYSKYLVERKKYTVVIIFIYFLFLYKTTYKLIIIIIIKY